MIREWLAALALVTFVGAAQASGQVLRTLDIERRLSTTEPASLRIEQVAGRLKIRGSDSADVTMQLRYDPRTVRPLYVASNGRLELGSRVRGGDVRIRGRSESGDLTLSLPRGVPLSLELHAGAIEGEVDLGGVRLERARVSSGAGSLTISFTAPNPVRMEYLELDAGAAALRVNQIGNANVARVHINQGVGAADLDFSGAWTGRMDAEIDVGVGAVSVRVPRDVGVRLEVRKFLATLDQIGLEKREDAYYSENYSSATRTLVIRVNTAVGKISLRRE